MAGRPIPLSLQSEKRTQRPNLVAIAESPLHSDSAGLGSVLLRPRSARRLRRPRRCYSGPLLRPATRDHLARASAHLVTTSCGPRYEALRNSATPTVGSRWRRQAGGRQIRNLKSEIPRGWVGRNVLTFNVQTFERFLEHGDLTKKGPGRTRVLVDVEREGTISTFRPYRPCRPCRPCRRRASPALSCPRGSRRPAPRW